MAEDSDEITRILHELRSGETSAQERLAGIVYKQLRKMAAAQLRQERSDHTLQPTALANEVYVRLLGTHVDWQSRAHFFAIAAQATRRILVDYARAHRAERRGGALQRVPLDNVATEGGARAVELLALDEAMERLKEFDCRQASVVEMTFFGGMTQEEIGEVLGVNVRTVKRDWAVAKAWLYGELNR